MRVPARYRLQIINFLEEFIQRFVAEDKIPDAVFYLNRMFEEANIKGIHIDL